MIERFLHLYQPLASILLEKSSAINILTTRELQDIKECKHLLQPLEDFTKKVSGEKYAVISTYYITTNKLCSRCNSLR